MLARSLLSSLLLTAMLATALPDAAWAGKSERRPAGQPANESEEKEKEESGKSEIEDGDDFEAFTVVADSHGWTARRWTLHELEISLFRRIHQHGPDHCRAPPALLL